MDHHGIALSEKIICPRCNSDLVTLNSDGTLSCPYCIDLQMEQAQLKRYNRKSRRTIEKHREKTVAPTLREIATAEKLLKTETNPLWQRRIKITINTLLETIKRVPKYDDRKTTGDGTNQETQRP